MEILSPHQYRCYVFGAFLSKPESGKHANKAGRPDFSEPNYDSGTMQKNVGLARISLQHSAMKTMSGLKAPRSDWL
jgi:hypothetical protein